MNLIHDRWIPVIRQDGTRDKIRPSELGNCENPAISIDAPRPDFRSAYYQFLIGLIQTVYAPADRYEWLDRYRERPSREELQKAFESFAPAFELHSESGPAFMQDLDLLREQEEKDIGFLLLGFPAVNTIAKNQDFFQRRDSIKGICSSCTAVALYSRQSYGVSFGGGHMTGMRGAGPVTTLLLTGEGGKPLWTHLWLNVLSHEDRFGSNIASAESGVFPWLGATRCRSKFEDTHPSDVHELQMFWSTPMRIRLGNSIEQGTCDLCGDHEILWQTFRAFKDGTRYSSTWRHAFSPYLFFTDQEGNDRLKAMSGSVGKISYEHWLALTLGSNSVGKNVKAIPASVVSDYFEWKLDKIAGLDAPFKLWCSGLFAEKSEVKCWYESTTPVIHSRLSREKFALHIQELTSASSQVSKTLLEHLKKAWATIGSKGTARERTKMNASVVKAKWIEGTEDQFFEMVNRLASSIEIQQAPESILAKWWITLELQAERLFFHFALVDVEDLRGTKSLTLAHSQFRKRLKGIANQLIEKRETNL